MPNLNSLLVTPLAQSRIFRSLNLFMLQNNGPNGIKSLLIRRHNESDMQSSEDFFLAFVVVGVTVGGGQGGGQRVETESGVPETELLFGVLVGLGSLGHVVVHAD